MGSGFVPPMGTRSLPLDLLRVQLVTREPARVSAAMSAWREGVAMGRSPQVMLPRRAMQQGWSQNVRVATTGPMQGPMQAAHSLTSAMAATLPPTMTSTIPAGVPVRSVHSVVPTYFPSPGPLPPAQPMLMRRPADQPLSPPPMRLPGPSRVCPPVQFNPQRIGLHQRWAALAAAQRVARFSR